MRYDHNDQTDYHFFTSSFAYFKSQRENILHDAVIDGDFCFSIPNKRVNSSWVLTIFFSTEIEKLNELVKNVLLSDLKLMTIDSSLYNCLVNPSQDRNIGPM